MTVTLIPEHIIISCDIEADGFRGVTLRLPPKRVGEVFRFFSVEGGYKVCPQLDYKGWSITGKVYRKKMKFGRNRWVENFIKITKTRRLTKEEKKVWNRKTSLLWGNKWFYESGGG